MDTRSGDALPVYKPGMRLVRRWRDEAHEIEILVQGYAYRGETCDGAVP